MKSAKRPPVPRNVERQLWSESCGFCMNPECLKQLIDESTEQNIGDMAHIEPYTPGEDVSADDLILLCATCHRKTEPRQVKNGKTLLQEWKRQAKQRISQQFSVRLSSFEDLEERVKPILERNYWIFKTYGPDSNRPEAYELWLKFEDELIANNSKLKHLLTRNSGLLHISNKEAVNEFSLHADEFVKTRKDKDKNRVLLFPHALLSVFGIEAASSEPAQNVSALQNFIAQLKEEGNFIDFYLFPEPTLKYFEDGERRCLSLYDGSRVRQIYFNRRLYHPHKTDLRLTSMIFFLNWFTKNGIEWKFEDDCDLTTVILLGKHRVKMFYSYFLSADDVLNTDLSPGDHVVNLHIWNKAHSSNDAIEYVDSLDIKIFHQNQFFVYCLKNIK